MFLRPLRCASHVNIHRASCFQNSRPTLGKHCLESWQVDCFKFLAELLRDSNFRTPWCWRRVKDTGRPRHSIWCKLCCWLDAFENCVFSALDSLSLKGNYARFGSISQLPVCEVLTMFEKTSFSHLQPLQILHLREWTDDKGSNSIYPQSISILHQTHILHSKHCMVQVWRWLQTAGADEAVGSPSSGQRKEEVTVASWAHCGASSEMVAEHWFLWRLSLTNRQWYGNDDASLFGLVLGISIWFLVTGVTGLKWIPERLPTTSMVLLSL